MNSRARNCSSAWLALRSLLWTILLPGVFAGYVPWRFFGLVRTQFDLTSPTELLGLVCIGLGVAVLSACIFEFARSGRARRSRRSTIRQHLRRRKRSSSTINCPGLRSTSRFQCSKRVRKLPARETPAKSQDQKLTRELTGFLRR